MGSILYGYDLGVPLNWSAYEDIAEFFTNDVKTIDGKPIYGHMDYGKKDPSLGWRFTDAWLSMAGTADIGIPNGIGGVGFDEGDVGDLVEGTMKQQRLLATAPKEVTEDDAAGIFTRSLELW